MARYYFYGEPLTRLRDLIRPGKRAKVPKTPIPLPQDIKTNASQSIPEAKSKAKRSDKSKKDKKSAVLRYKGNK